MKIKRCIKNESILIVVLGLLTFLLLLNIFSINASVYPQGPDNLVNSENRTKANVSAKFINNSGGEISFLELNATVQNTRWKAFVGNVSGMLTLDDASGSTIFDWTLTTITGRIYATRNSSYIDWTSINCSNITHLIAEDSALVLTSADDNITKTFNASYNNTQNFTASGNHSEFYAGTKLIYESTCPVLKTYVNNASQEGSFEEIALYDGVSMVYATILENDTIGYNTERYDFQMIVPENGSSSFTSSTAYYIYAEID